MDKIDVQKLIQKHVKSSYKPGEVLFKEGDKTGLKRLHIIYTGRVQLTKRIFKTETTIEILGPGDFFGEWTLLAEMPHPVTATVLETASFLKVDAKGFVDMAKANPEIALRIIRKLSSRLAQLHFRLTNFTLRHNMARLLHQLRWEALYRKQITDIPLYPEGLADVLGMEVGEVHRLLKKAVKAQLIVITGSQFSIASQEAFDRYLAYLELKDRFNELDA